MRRRDLLIGAGILAGCSRRVEGGGELRAVIRRDPGNLDPLRADEMVSELIRYCTGGSLIRLDRRTQQLSGELAEFWAVTPDSRGIRLRLRPGLRFSNGQPVTARDVAATFHRLLDPQLHSPAGDIFGAGRGVVDCRIANDRELTATFPQPLGNLPRALDQVSISPAGGEPDSRVTAGWFTVAEHRAGQYVLLRRNRNYWRSAGPGRSPQLDAVRLIIQPSRTADVARFERGDVDLINDLDQDGFQQLRRKHPAAALDAGPSVDPVVLWWNLAPQAPLAPHKSEWFQLAAFRLALAQAINKADLARLAWGGYATPAAGPNAPQSTAWRHNSLPVPGYDPAAARQRLQAAGFRYDGSRLLDQAGRPVSFSLIVNSGSRTAQSAAELIRKDFAAVGVELIVAPLESGALIERLSRTRAYDACLFSFLNLEPDPVSQASIWPSDAPLHGWNPLQSEPATPWEQQIDAQFRVITGAASPAARKAAWDCVQEIAAREMPLVHLVYPHALMAAGPRVEGAQPLALVPYLLAGVDTLRLRAA